MDKIIPTHVGIILDGNRRWAKSKGKIRAFGHENGTKSVRTTVESCAQLGIEHLTLYAFSTENWNRPKLEVDLLMELLINSLKNELKTLQENNIKLNAIGNLTNLQWLWIWDNLLEGDFPNEITPFSKKYYEYSKRLRH